MPNKKIKLTLVKLHLKKHEAVLSRLQLIIFVLIFAGLGTTLILLSHAATAPIATMEAEQTTLTAGIAVISDTAAGSGKALRFAANGTATGQITLPTSAASLTVRAKGVQCNGAPQATIKIDGVQVQSSAISAINWTDYSATSSVTSGTHTLTISYANDYSKVAGNSGSIKCDRDLFVDSVAFYGQQTSVTPAPTVAFSASPTAVAAGSSSTLTWSSTNATSCVASGGWSGAEPTSGSFNTGSMNTTTTYTLSCSGAGGSASANAAVTVTTVQATAGSAIYWGARMDGDVYGRTGDAPWDATTWDTFEQHTAKKASIVHFGQPAPWAQSFSSTPVNLAASRGAIPLMSMDTNTALLSDIAAGTYDSSITTWAQAAKANAKPFMLRWDWEMNLAGSGAFSWAQQAKANPSQYVAAWKHFHDIVQAQGASNVTWVWCPNVEYSGSTPLSSLYPGDSYVDWTCMDGYNWGTNPLKPQGWQTFAQVFQSTYNSILALAPNKPVMIGETGSSEYGGSKASWTTDALKTQLPTNFPKIKALVWFNWNITEGSGRLDWPIESSSTAQSAFSAGISSSYFTSNSYGSLPPLTKISAP